MKTASELSQQERQLKPSNELILKEFEVIIMREEYNINELNPRKNPYASQLKKQITINIDGSTIDYFKSQAESSGIPYQTLINLYLRDCAANQRQLQMSWT